MPVLLSRLQFAFTVAFHFLMVPLTIGLILFVLIFELLYLRTGRAEYRKQSDFWTNLFALNFVLGIVTGVTMEIQFGTNWAAYSTFMGDIFGSPLAFEALMAFFLESTFGGILIFYRHKISARFRALTAALVFVGTHVSAVWIITANGFMHNPVGYELAADGSRVVLTDFVALVLNPYALFMLLHTVTSAYLLGAFFVLAVCAWHLLRKQHREFALQASRYALAVLLVAAVSQPMVGHFYGQYIGGVQPAKAALFELNWESQESAPLHLVQIPLPSQERNIDLLGIPYLGSLMHTNTFTGRVTGIKEATAAWTPEMKDSFYAIIPLTYFSFRIMVGLGGLFVLLAVLGVYYMRQGTYAERPLLLKAFLYLLPTPWIAITLGWIVAEVGRQPWLVYDLMLTADGVSPNVSADQVLFSLGSLVVFYGVLFAVLVYLLRKFIVLGPLANPFRDRG